MSDVHTHGHEEHGHEHADHGSLKSYSKGFILSVILTAIPFWLVMGKVITKSSDTAIVLLALGAIQIVVHMIYFLHMNTKSERGWSVLSLIFTIMVVVIMLSGSLWVMYHLNHNMMPGMMTEPSAETKPESLTSLPAAKPVDGPKEMDSLPKEQ